MEIRKTIRWRLKTHSVEDETEEKRWEIIDILVPKTMGWHSWASSKSNSKHVNKGEQIGSSTSTCHFASLMSMIFKRPSTVGPFFFGTLRCVYGRVRGTLSPVFRRFTVENPYNEHPKTARIKLTQNALSISPQKLIFGRWSHPLLNSFHEVTKRANLMIIIFICSQPASHLNMLISISAAFFLSPRWWII